MDLRTDRPEEKAVSWSRIILFNVFHTFCGSSNSSSSGRGLGGGNPDGFIYVGGTGYVSVDDFCLEIYIYSTTQTLDFESHSWALVTLSTMCNRFTNSNNLK